MLSLQLILLALCSPLVLSACQNGATLIQRNKFTCGNKQYIVDYHNKIRNYVASGRIESQPKAANMVEFRWSDELAKLAQKRADTCLFEHGDLELDGERVGQNLAIVFSTANNLRLNITYMMDIWYNEVFQYGYKEGFEPNSGHYSQLIWGNTREVGCGYAYYKEDWYKMLFVCDYFPPGNYIGQKPYVYGKHNCKEYGLQNSHRYSKLCAVDNKEISVCKGEIPLTELDTIDKVSLPESNEVDFDGKLDGNNVTASSNESTVDEIGDTNDEDEVVTENYEGLDEPDGAGNWTQAENDEQEPTNNGTDEGTNTNETTKQCTIESILATNKTIEDMERLFWYLHSIKDILSGNLNSMDASIAEETASNGTSTDEISVSSTSRESDEMLVLTSDKNRTLEMLNESLELAVEILETFKGNKRQPQL